MTSLARAIEAEKRMRESLAENGLPQPDYIEYGVTCIRLFFNRSKLVVVIELDECAGGHPFGQAAHPRELRTQSP
jgi:hypothetical protein